MQNDLELLLKLQMIDYDLGELERSKEYLPDMMENLHREIRDVTDRLSQVSELLASSRAKQKTLELDIKVKEAALTKYQQQMMSIKTNKEYDALVAEIDSLKEEISQKESRLLETIDKIKLHMKEWCNMGSREEFRETMHEFRDIGRLLFRKAHHIDPDKLARIRKVASQACHDIEAIID